MRAFATVTFLVAALSFSAAPAMSSPTLRAEGSQFVLTLDDGYVDNWVALTPLLQAYGFNAIVFASTDFVDPRPVVRPRVGDGARESALEWKGYLSWDEMRAAEASGTIEIQSHAKTHTWYFTSDKIID